MQLENKKNKDHIFIESFQNQKLKAFKKNTLNEDFILLQGWNTIEQTLSKNLIRKVLINEKYYSELIKNLKDEKVQIYITTNSNMEKIYKNKKINKIMALIDKEKINKVFLEGNYLILDNIQDPSNLGLLIRSAAAFNFKNILLSKDSVNPYNHKVINASQGMFFNICIQKIDIYNFLNQLKSSNILGTFLNEKSLPLNKSLNIINENEKIYLILGNEGKGINNKYKKFINHNIKITMNNNIDSLNLAMAGSIIMGFIFNKIL